jgi:hypothetical protein
MDDMNSETTGNSQLIIYQTKDGKLKIDVRFQDETVWLSQKLMAELFQKDVRTINEHIQNVFEENELTPQATILKFRIVQAEGSRQVERSDSEARWISSTECEGHSGSCWQDLTQAGYPTC